MTITADMIKDLRQQSGAGIMECKEALKNSDGDIDGALDFLRKKGAGKAAKKADRTTKEGAVGGVVSGAKAALVEIKCETDFVARNDKFQELCKLVAEHIVASEHLEDATAFMEQPMFNDSSKAVKDLVAENIHELGENIVIERRVQYRLASSGGFGLYIHGVGGVGTLVEVACDSDDVANDSLFKELCHDLAMHITASRPASVGVDDLPADLVAKEREIFEAQAKESGKPDKIIPKIVDGRMKKFYTEACLLEQPFVKDTDINVKQLVEDTAKKLGSGITVNRFSRLNLGE